MRPVRLEVVGFSAFHERAEISFAGTDLVAFVGPTGSGKSSLIDAMTFALYGSVSRYDNASLVEPVIHKLATEARVALDFEVGDVAYTAVRVVRRTKQGASTREARLVRHGPDDGDDGTVLAATAAEVSVAVRGLLGLDFDQFTRTVVLPQGRFAAFLREDRGRRQQLLRQLLDAGIYDRMGVVARRRAAEAEAGATLLVDQRAGRPEIGDTELATLAERASGLAALSVACGPQLDRLATHEAEVGAAAGTVRELAARRQALLDLVVPPVVADLAADLAAAEAAADGADVTLAAARATRDAAHQAQADGPDVAAVERTLEQVTRFASLQVELSELRPRLATAADRAVAARVEAERAAQARDDADGTLAQARAAAGAEALVAGLVVGQPCPVCSQLVADIPAHDLGAELQAATRAARTAKQAAERAAEARAAADLDHGRLEDQTQARTDQLARGVALGLADVDEADLRAQQARAAELQQLAQAAAGAATEAERGVTAARAALEQVRGREVALRSAYTAARDSVADRQPPAPAGRALPEDWESLASSATSEVGPVQAEAAAAEQAQAEAGAALDRVRAELVEACRPFAVDPEPRGLAERIATAAARADHEHADAVRSREERAVLDGQIAALVEQQAVQHQMGLHLSAKGFERWLLQEAIDDLVARATERLLELSAGQFSLGSTDGDLWILDHRNADERRDVRTLSGGETFLASLALALALADNVAELAVDGGPRLESMFLDEGFGTLDPETLDTVAATMEELSASGRLIGIVTHIRDLADRMPVRFEVSRDATSARVRLVEA